MTAAQPYKRAPQGHTSVTFWVKLPYRESRRLWMEGSSRMIEVQRPEAFQTSAFGETPVIMCHIHDKQLQYRASAVAISVI